MRIRLFKNKEQKKRLERWCGRQWVRLIMFCSRFLSLKGVRIFSRFLGVLGYYLIVRHRRKAMYNVNLVYGKEKSPKELRGIVRRTFIHASCFGWELLYFYSRDLSDEKIEDVVKEVKGLQHLSKAMARGKGVIGLGAHLGNFVILAKKLDSLGFPSTTIMRQMKDGKLETMFDQMKIKFNQHWIPKLPVSRAIRESITWLRKGKILMIYMDQRSGRGVKVNFMGIPTPTPTGAAVFALKTEAAVLPMFNVQDEKGHCKLIIDEEVPIERTGDHNKDVFVNTERFNKVIEKYIRLYPDQWFWFHDRWKGVKIDGS